jgi:hypothetical protein
MSIHIMLQYLPTYLVNTYYTFYLMISRITQLSRHLSRPLPNYLHTSASAFTPAKSLTSRAMAAERSKKTIHTAACLIIGDEVLGGKVSQTCSSHSGDEKC